ncbi:MAG: HisA/HisF-related TIM barrel protein [Pirellulaceae bacterium]
MNLYGVLDLKAGQVVRGVAGRRETYQPVRSVIARTSAPGDVAGGLLEHLGLRRAYVADLDAIAGHAPNWAALTAIANAGLELLVDAGCGDRDRAVELAEFAACGVRLQGVVVGLESLGIEDLSVFVQAIGVERAVLSLDLHEGRPIVGAESLRGQSPQAIAAQAWSAGFRRIIVLDLAGVGVAGGPMTLRTCSELRRQWRWQELISGGGVRHSDDLLALQHAGCDGVLLASALHAGTLCRADLAAVCSGIAPRASNGAAD